MKHQTYWALRSVLWPVPYYSGVALGFVALAVRQGMAHVCGRVVERELEREQFMRTGKVSITVRFDAAQWKAVAADLRTASSAYEASARSSAVGREQGLVVHFRQRARDALELARSIEDQAGTWTATKPWKETAHAHHVIEGPPRPAVSRWW